MKDNSNNYKGSETVKGEQNFPYERGKPFDILIKSLFYVKLAALNTNLTLGFIDEEKYNYIQKAILEGIEGKLNKYFNITMYQGGAGTSLNMNVNEVIAMRSLQLADKIDNYEYIHPLNHINLHQSTNDVIPTAGRVAILFVSETLENSVLKLQEVCQEKEKELDSYVKPSKTQLQDAVPITLGREFSAFSSVFARDRWRIFKIKERLREVNLGGTAIGTGFLAPRKYIFKVSNELKKLTGLPVARADNLVDATANTDLFVEAHGFLNSLATSLIKVSTDLRLMNSGPENGFGEIKLKKVQVGSSIMPSKVNPVLPEYTTSCAFRVISNQTLISQSSSFGNFQLNPFIPLIIHVFLESMFLLIEGCNSLKNAIENLEVIEDNFNKINKSDSVLVYVLAGQLGYEKANRLFENAKTVNKTLYTYVVENNVVTKNELDKLLTPENILKLGF